MLRSRNNRRTLISFIVLATLRFENDDDFTTSTRFELKFFDVCSKHRGNLGKPHVTFFTRKVNTVISLKEVAADLPHDGDNNKLSPHRKIVKLLTFHNLFPSLLRHFR